MSQNDDTVKKWIEIGKAQTTPIENKDYPQVEIDSYYVVIGFEVNNPKAYVGRTYYPLENYGHAFFMW